MREFVRETEHGSLYVDEGCNSCEPSEYTLVSNFTGREYPSCEHGSTVDIKGANGSLVFTDGNSGTVRTYCMLCIMDYLSSKIPEL